MNENIKSIFVIKNFVFCLLFLGGVIGLILLPFYFNEALALTVTPSVEVESGLAPSAPTNLIATQISNSAIDLSWTAGVGALSYKIYRNTVDSSWDALIPITTGETEITYSDSGLNSYTTYYYKVKSTNTFSDSGFSTVASDTTFIDIPIGLISTAISSSQINLSWTIVVGADSYNIYRDSSLISTGQISISYSDSGLSASTSYSYTVSAVNTDGETSQSIAASTTTLAEGGGGGGAIPISPIPLEVDLEKSLIINNGDIYTNSLEVILTLSVKNASQMAISNYSNFTGISWESYQTTKKWALNKDDGKKTVYAKFRGFQGGVSKMVSDSIILDTIAPFNISNFQAVSGDSQIILNWQNPSESDFKTVKIFRSTKFYPANPEEGVLVYNGKGSFLINTGLINGIRYYYTVFAYDQVGNYSSGAIVSVVPSKIKPSLPLLPEKITTEKECIEAGFYWYDNICHLKPEVVPFLSLEIEKLTLEDFEFIQENKKILLEEGIKIKTEIEKPLTVSISYDKVPEVLKTIMVTLEKEEKFFSFLLKVNPEKTAYLSTLVLPKEAGIYPLILTTFNYKNQTIKRIFGQLEVKKTEIRSLLIPWYQDYKILFYIFCGIILIPIFLIYFFRKRRFKII